MELMLSEELLGQVESISNSAQPEGVEKTLLDFDDKGNVHVRKRDGDGKLLEDIHIKENASVSEQKSYYEEMSEEYTELLKKKEKAAMRMNILMGTILVLAVAAMLIVLKLKG